MESQKIKDLFAGERFGCGLGHYWITGSRSQMKHNASLNRLEYKLACLLKEEDEVRKAKFIEYGRYLEAYKQVGLRKELRGIISEQNDTIKLYKKADDKSGRLKDILLLRITELNRKVDSKELLNQELTRQIEELNGKNKSLLAELKGQQSKNRAQEDRLEHLKSLNYDLLDANDKLKRTNKALLTACDKYYEELTEARGGQENTCNCNKNKTEDKNV